MVAQSRQIGTKGAATKRGLLRKRESVTGRTRDPLGLQGLDHGRARRAELPPVNAHHEEVVSVVAASVGALLRIEAGKGREPPRQIPAVAVAGIRLRLKPVELG